MTSNPHVLLASESPRRGQLLAQIGVRYERVAAAVSETRQAAEAPEDYVRRLALEKARCGWQHGGAGSRCPALGADTAVVLERNVLGKPDNHEQACRMLTRLAGRTHRVLTAVAMVDCEREASCLNESRVRFRPMTPAECRRYAETGEPLDKAGAYAIQGHAAVFIEHLEGSYSGVMGLPLFETWKLIVDFGINVEWK